MKNSTKYMQETRILFIYFLNCCFSHIYKESLKSRHNIMIKILFFQWLIHLTEQKMTPVWEQRMDSCQVSTVYQRGKLTKATVEYRKSNCWIQKKQLSKCLTVAEKYQQIPTNATVKH